MNRLLVLMFALVGSALAATTYPFPYMADYPYGIRPASITAAVPAKIQANYTQWLDQVWADCPDGQKARIKWVDPKASAHGGCTNDGSCTVSEGIGYGMLITVYMDNATNSTQSKFDKLWAYYKAFSNQGVMDWLVDGCNGVKEGGGATDAEVDVALALAMAYKQWGDSKYLDGAKTLLGQIWSLEVKNNLIWSGSKWTDAVYNPSYFAIGAMRNVFAKVDASHDWVAAANASLTLLTKNQSSKGLNSDWCNSNGDPVDKNGSGTTKFGYDAVRTPYRVLLDYLWSGNASSKAALEKINNWTMTTYSTPGLIRAEYLRDGTGAQTYTNACYMGALALPGMVRDTAATWVQKSYTALTGPNTNPMNDLTTFYYEGSWQMLYLLTVTGAFQNYWGTVKPNSVGIIGADGRSVPAGWAVRSTERSITVSLPGEGSVDLIDAKGQVLGSAQGSKELSLARPNQRGVFFAVVRSAGHQAAFSVVGD